MSGRGTCVFVESNTSGTGRAFAAAAKRRGYRPVLLAKQPARYPYVATDAIEAITCETDRAEAIDAACAAIGDLRGITSSSEYFIGAAARVARRLGLAGPDPDAVARCRDKALQRAAFERAGVPSPRSLAVDSVAGAVAAARSIGFPVVVKPATGTGSIGVRRCATAQEVEGAAGAQLGATVNERGTPVPPRVLVEQCLLGSEYSVELFDGDVICVTRKHPGEAPYFVAVQHDVPSDPHPELERVAIAATRALGLGWGPIHVELCLTIAGAMVIEVNPRLAGAMIPALVQLALGVDLVDATIAATLGEPAELAGRAPQRHASIRFVLRPGHGRLRGFAGLPAARAVAAVVQVDALAAPGESLERRGDFRDRIGQVIAVADRRTGVEAALAEAMQQIVVEIDDVQPEATR